MYTKKELGFTLIELLVVIGIIAALTSIAMIGINAARNKARTVKCQHDSDAIYHAITAMSNDTNEWPGHQDIDAVNSVNGNEICGDGCTFGVSSNQAGLTSSDGTYSSWSGPYINLIPKDPWNHEYFFDTDYLITPEGLPCNGGSGCIEAVVIGSYGPDGVGNNQCNADDIIKVIAQ